MSPVKVKRVPILWCKTCKVSVPKKKCPKCKDEGTVVGWIETPKK